MVSPSLEFQPLSVFEVGEGVARLLWAPLAKNLPTPLHAITSSLKRFNHRIQLQKVVSNKQCKKSYQKRLVLWLTRTSTKMILPGFGVQNWFSYTWYWARMRITSRNKGCVCKFTMATKIASFFSRWASPSLKEDGNQQFCSGCYAIALWISLFLSGC